MTEYEIIRGIIAKDRKSQKAFVDNYAPYLLGVCRRYIKDTGLVKDCLQESLIKIMTKIGQYKEKGQFKSWIAKIAVNECLQFIRKNKKHTTYEISDYEGPIINEDSTYKLEKEDVIKFLDTLPDNYRIAINMYLIEGYSHKEIGRHLGITESSSRSLVTRGRKKINDLFHLDHMRVVHRNRTQSQEEMRIIKS